MAQFLDINGLRTFLAGIKNWVTNQLNTLQSTINNKADKLHTHTTSDITDYNGIPSTGGIMTGDLILNANLTTTLGHLTLNRNTVIEGNTTVNGTLNVSGKTTIADLDTDSIYLNGQNYWNTSSGIVTGNISANGLYINSAYSMDYEGLTADMIYTNNINTRPGAPSVIGISDIDIIGDDIYTPNSGRIRIYNETNDMNKPTLSIEKTGMYWRREDDSQYDSSYIPTAWGGFIQLEEIPTNTLEVAFDEVF